jgi:CHAT domain-containing protein
MIRNILLKILIATLFLLIKQSAYSQIEQFNYGNELYKQKLFDKALVVFESIDTINIEKNKNGDTFKFLKIFWIANCNYNLKEYKIADSLFKKAIYKCLQVYKKTDPIYYTCLAFSANCKIELNLYNEAINILNQKVLFNRDNKFKNFTDIISDYEWLGDMYVKIDNYKAAISSYLNVLKLTVNQKDSLNEDRVILLYNLATTYLRDANYRESEKNFIRSLNIAEKVYKNDSSNLSYILIGIADLYTMIGTYDKAKSFYERAIKVEKLTKGINNRDYFLSLNHLSSFYNSTGEFNKAEDLYIKTEGEILKQFGDKNIDYLSTINGLSNVYMYTQNIDKAELYINKSIEITNSIYEVNDIRRAFPLINLANLYLYKNDVFKSDSLFHKALRLYEISLGKKHPAYNIVLNNIAQIAQRLGQSKIAEEYLIEINNNEKNNDSTSFTYSNSLSSLGFFYIEQGQINKALAFLLKSYELQVKSKSKFSYSIIQTKNLLSQAYSYLGENHKAINISISNIENIRNSIGKNNISYCGSMNTLAVAYYNIGKYDSAINILKEVINIETNSPYPNFNSLSTYYLNLTKDYLKIKKIDNAVETFIKSKDAINNNINQSIFQLTSNQKERKLIEINIKIDTLKSIFINNKELQGRTSGALFDLELIKKSLILRSSNYLNNIVNSSKDSIFKYSLDQLNSVKKKLIDLYSNKSIDNELTKIFENKSEILEKELIYKSNNAFVIKNNLNVSWIDIQKSLKPNQVCVEFTGFVSSKFADSISYGVIILKAEDTAPAFISLFKQNELSNLLFNYNNLISNKSRQDATYSFNRNGKLLYELIWSKIDKIINSKTEVLITPYGLLHKLNLNAIPFDSTNNLGAKYNTRIITSSADIIVLNKKTNEKLNKDIIIFGGINYDNIDNSIFKFDNIDRGADKNSNWIYLPNTYNEGHFIDSICKLNNIKSNFYSGAEASKTKLINVSKNGNIIHIATHGYFYPDSITNDMFSINTQPNNPNSILLKSGLVFSGANKHNSNNSSFVNDNGILSAYDISNLNLTNTELVVLSACETGLGDIKGSEGIYGLQRSFKLAGANKIIMSLWKIPDLQTKELMMIFYQNYFKEKSASESLQIAQTTMSKKYSPYYWAAFKLLE